MEVEGGEGTLWWNARARKMYRDAGGRDREREREQGESRERGRERETLSAYRVGGKVRTFRFGETRKLAKKDILYCPVYRTNERAPLSTLFLASLSPLLPLSRSLPFFLSTFLSRPAFGGKKGAAYLQKRARCKSPPPLKPAPHKPILNTTFPSSEQLLRCQSNP